MNRELNYKALGSVLALLMVLLSPVAANAQKFTPTQERLENREQFRDEKFGIFIHWGIYSMLAAGEWAQNTMDIDPHEYAKLAGGFYPANFNAEEWVSAIKAAGAKYITITTRHHDGFSMFGTKYSGYNIVDATPFKRDIIKELAEECARQGIALHFYYSLIDWSREDAPEGGSDDSVRKGVKKDPDKLDEYFDFIKNQLTELLTNYGDVVRAIWFDGHWDQNENPDFDWRYDEIYGLIHDLRPDVLVANNHHLAPFDGEDFQIFERDLPGDTTATWNKGQVSDDLPLETCETMNGMWGYKIIDQNYKDVPTLIKYIVSTAGRNGNLLLNIGPQPDGCLPETAIERLKGIGEWMDKYGDTIYGTRGGETLPHDWGVMVSKGNKRYVHILKLADNSLFVPFTAGKVQSAVCVNSGEKIPFSQDDNGILLKLGVIPTEIDHIIELTLK